MYEFTKTPRWIVGHVFAMVMLIIFVMAGFWQLSRHQSQSELSESITLRRDIAAAGLDAILANAEPVEAEYRRATAGGVFEGPDVMIRNQSLDGQPGCHVLSVLVQDDGSGVIVNRGWVPLAACETAVTNPISRPAAALELTGRIRQTRERGRFGAVDPPDGVLTTMARVDLDRIQDQVDRPLAPVYLEQIAPAGESPPVRVREPETDNGPHLGYAVQWFLFAAVLVVGYPLVLRKQSRS